MNARIWDGEIPVEQILDSYRRTEEPSTGTVVIHAGRVKLPGKKVEKMTHVILEPVCDDPACGLDLISVQAKNRYAINRVQIHHRVGTALAGDDLLLVFVSSRVRGPAFDACRWIVNEIKREKIIRLAEIKREKSPCV